MLVGMPPVEELARHEAEHGVAQELEPLVGRETTVQLTVLPEVGESPLPRINPRFGHPTPQRGVEVERKWNRSDYRKPGNQLVQIQKR